MEGGSVSIKAIDVGRPSLLWVAPFPKQGVLTYLRVKQHACICFSLLLITDEMQVPTTVTPLEL